MTVRNVIEALSKTAGTRRPSPLQGVSLRLFEAHAARFPSATLRSKIALLVFIVLGVSMFTFYMIAAQIIDNYILDEIIKRATFLSRNVAASAAYSSLSDDLLGVDNVVFKAKEANQDVAYVAILDPAMKAVAHSDIKLSGTYLESPVGQVIRKLDDGTVIREVEGSSGQLIEVSSPVTLMNRRLGTLLFGVQKRVLTDAQEAIRLKILGAFGALLLFGVGGTLILSTVITKPIQALASGVDEMKNGSRNQPLAVYSNDELGKLTQSFNEMTALITDQRDRLNEYARDLEQSYVSIVKVVAAALDARDTYTHGHSVRVARLSLQIGKSVGLTPEELADLEVACLLHDIGKMRIPDSILRKTSRLDPAEYREIMAHTHYGAEILDKAPSLRKYIPSVRHHHEWFNGRGYPDGLCHDEIPLFASIISIADAFDAMTSNRPYRRALTEEAAIREMTLASGIQFNPELLEAFLGTRQHKEHTAAVCTPTWII